MVQDPQADPTLPAERREEMERVERALAGLSPAHAEVVELALVQGLPYARIAEVLDIPVGTVKSRVFHAVRRLRALLEGEEEIGSPNLVPFIKKQKKLLACDAVVVSDTAMFSKTVPSICYGLRGLAYLEISARGTRGDLHSGSFGGAVVNPAGEVELPALVMLASSADTRGATKLIIE
mgnify:CR=1 FL=1